jgi:CHAD domain-containing protein
MPLDADRIQKPVRKLRKLLKKLPKQPAPEQIHDFRTGARRLEATLDALGLDSRRNERRTLRKLKRLRRLAGKIRDMDVLTGYLSGVQVNGERDCEVQLLEHLGAERSRNTKKMRRLVRRYRAALRRRLKRSAAHLDQVVRQQSKSPDGSKPPAGAMASALQLSAQLRTPQHLDRKNLHPYRLKVKELRYVLQMAGKADQQRFVDSLGEVKDAIGEWHDWEELIAIANQVLDHGQGCRLVAELRRVSDAKFERALARTNEMKEKYVVSAGQRKPGARRAKKTNGLTTPVVTAASGIAA